MAHVTFEQILQILWSFCLGLADSLRGAVDLFLLDSAAVRNKEKKMVQRDLKKEVLLNRDSPARDIVGMDNFAKKRALERRERAASSSSTRNVTMCGIQQVLLLWTIGRINIYLELVEF